MSRPFSQAEVQVLNVEAWNGAVSKCREIINQAADDYQEMGAGLVARQLRCVSMLLEEARREVVASTP